MPDVLPLNLPPAEAVEFFRRKGLRESFDWQEVYAEEHARVFTVAKSAGFDILEDVRAAVDKAIAEGTTLRDFRRELTPLLQRKGWWGRQTLIDPLTGEERTVQLGSPRRLATIYDTNLRTGYAAGRWEQIQRTKERRPYLRYVAILDERTRPQHRAWHGTVLPADDPWWQSHFPPNGWRCRCSVQQLGERDLQRYGYEVSPGAPSTLTSTYVNPRTGEVRQVPVGIDPGFDANAGRAGQAAKLLADKLAHSEGVDAAIALWGEVSDIALPMLQREYAEWAAPIIREVVSEDTPAHLRGDIRIIGVLTPRTVSHARGLGIEPGSAGILLEDRQIGHMRRAKKVLAGIALPGDVILRLPLLLSAPKAVLWDKRKKNLLYVFSLEGEATRSGMLAVEIEFPLLVRERGRRETVTINSVRTAGIMPSETLQNRGVYDVVEGAL